MHENFIGKKSLLNAMTDTAVLATLKFHIEQNEIAVIRYSDDNNSVSMNANFEFLNQSMKDDIKKQHGYGFCIFYLQKYSGGWQIHTVHLDIHCRLCNF